MAWTPELQFMFCIEQNRALNIHECLHVVIDISLHGRDGLIYCNIFVAVWLPVCQLLGFYLPLTEYYRVLALPIVTECDVGPN